MQQVYHWQPRSAVQYSEAGCIGRRCETRTENLKLFEELRRRNVFRVAIGYIIASWLVLQVTDVVMGILELPSWIGRFVFFALLLGFPLALAFSWAFQLTPEGLKRDSEVAQSEVATVATGRKLDLAIIVLLVISLAYFVLDKFVFTPTAQTAATSSPPGFEKSIAVLPFIASGEEEGDLFATGIHDDLLTQLARIGDLHVISRTSVMEYAGTTKNLTQIGKELGVLHILEGGVQKIGDQVRINAQLIDARTDRHLWAETFDRELTVDNIFKVQSEIVHRITDSLQATLLAQTGASIETPPTKNLDAYRDYLSALHSQATQEVRIALLQSAVEKDPQFALAWVQLAFVWQQIFWFDPERPEALEKSEEALRRAATIDPDLPQLHRTRAIVLYHGYLDYEAALGELELAEAGLPGDSEIFQWRANIYRHMQRIPEAIESYQRALDLDPRSEWAIYELGIALSLGRYFDQERSLWEQAITDFPEYPVAFNWQLATVDWFQHGDSHSQLEVMSRPYWPKYERREALFALKHWQAGQMSEALRYAHLIEPDEEHEVRVFRPSSANVEQVFAEVIKAAILIETGAADEASAILEPARARVEEEIAGSDHPHWWSFADLASVLALMGETEAASEAVAAMVDTFDEPDRIFQLAALHETSALTMCMLGEFAEVEADMRWLLSHPTSYTLASLLNDWPPCRDRFRGTENYQRLHDEFGHLSNGNALK
jgi:TolB-like protein/Tfp pilus assembly protein PilF